MPIQLSKAQPLGEWYELVNQAMLVPVKASQEVHFANFEEQTTAVSQLADETEKTLELAEESVDQQSPDDQQAEAAQLNPWVDQAQSTEQFAQELGYVPESKESLAYASDYQEASSITSWFQDTFSAISGLGANSKTWWTAAASAVSGLASETSLLDSFGRDSDDDAQRESETLGQSSLSAQDQNAANNSDQDNQTAGSDVSSDLSSAAQGLISALRPQATGLSDSNELGEQLALLESQLALENPELSTNAAVDTSAQISSTLYLYEAALVVEPVAGVEVFGI